MEENQSLEEIQARINEKALETIGGLIEEIATLKNTISEMNGVILEINKRSLEFIPHILSSYTTLLETELANKLKINFDKFNAIVSEGKSGMI